jgi:hypothetical protein
MNVRNHDAKSIYKYIDSTKTTQRKNIDAIQIGSYRSIDITIIHVVGIFIIDYYLYMEILLYGDTQI